MWKSPPMTAGCPTASTKEATLPMMSTLASDRSCERCRHMLAQQIVRLPLGRCARTPIALPVAIVGPPF
eukprot:7460979-Pyramimonas_sp.AAC.1